MSSTIKKGYDNNGLMIREFIDNIISDDDLCKALKYTDEQFYNKKITKEEKKQLIRVNIHPFDYVPNVQTEAKSYITMKFEYFPNKVNSLLKVGRITFFCFCHSDLMYIDHQQLLRPIYIANHLSKLLNDKRNETWLGKLTPLGGLDIKRDEMGTYRGIALGYQSDEFM